MGEAGKLNPNDSVSYSLKTNLCIWLVYASERFQMHMEAELSKCDNLNVEYIALTRFSADGIKTRPSPDLVFIETGVNWAKKLMDLQEQEVSNLSDSDASLIVFGDESDNGALKIALRIGASDFLSHRAHIDELMPVLRHTANEKVASKSLGELCLFVNSKGGSGATTLATNVAADIAKDGVKKVILVDLDIQFGVTPDYLDLSLKYGISDALENVNDLDEISLSSFVTNHSSGLDLIGYTSYGTHENYQLARNFAKLLPILRQHYDYVIVDLSRGIEHVYTSIIAPASKVYLIAQQNLISVKHSTELIRILQLEYGLNKDSIEIVMNRFEKNLPISLKDIKHTIDNINIHLVPNDYKTAVESANLGKPFVLSGSRSALAKSVIAISASLYPHEEESKSWFGRLFS